MNNREEKREEKRREEKKEHYQQWRCRLSAEDKYEMFK
jgi:hypothetical protein